MQQHDELLDSLAKWFRSVQSAYGGRMQCAKGCARCCHGLFDVSLPDAMRIAHGYRLLPEVLKSAVAGIALDIQHQIVRECPELKEPCFLHELSEDRIDSIVDRIGEVRCPMLDEGDRCLIYDLRPLACRLEGVPMVDAHDGVFGDWCELNFREGVTPELAESLRLDYCGIQAIEGEATAKLSKILLGTPHEQVTLFIPSVITALDLFTIVCREPRRDA